MFKTSKAYFRQTVIEGSPLNRFTSNIFGQARQSFEALFRRTGRVEEIVSRQAVLSQFGARASRGGIVAKIHANSRGVLTKFVERNRTSELVNTMRQRFGWSGRFRSGLWGQKLATFAFVGVGFAAGAQCNASDETRYQDRLPNVMEWFHKPELKVASHLDADGELETRVADFEFDVPLSLNEHQSSESCLLLFSFVEDAANTSDDRDELSSDDDGFIAVERTIAQPDADTVAYETEDEPTEQYLIEQLSRSLSKVEEQRVELDSLRLSVTQLNRFLNDLVGPTAAVENSVELDEPSTLEIEWLQTADKGSGDMKDRLIRTLSVIGQQQMQLNSLKQQLLIQNEQLSDILQTAAARPIIVRSSLSKRDACCGPGSDKEM